MEPIALATTAYRHIAQGRHPLSGVGARLHGGRWNPSESFATLYLALERETTVAEFFRLVARQERSPEEFLPRELHRYEVELAAVLDLRERSAREAVLLTDERLCAADPQHCQQIGRIAWDLGIEAVLAPSATGHGTVLAVYVEDMSVGSHVVSVDATEWVVPPSAPLVTLGGDAQRLTPR